MNRFLALSLLPAVMAQNYLGCYDEAVGARALTGAVTYDFAAMVPSECETFCTVKSVSQFSSFLELTVLAQEQVIPITEGDSTFSARMHV